MASEMILCANQQSQHPDFKLPGDEYVLCLPYHTHYFSIPDILRTPSLFPIFFLTTSERRQDGAVKILRVPKCRSILELHISTCHNVSPLLHYTNAPNSEYSTSIQDILFRSSPVCRSLCSNIAEPRMREGFVRCEPFHRIKVCQASDKIFEVRVEALHIPTAERLTWVLFIEAVPKRF